MALTPHSCPRCGGAVYDDTSNGAPERVCLVCGHRIYSSAPLPRVPHRTGQGPLGNERPWPTARTSR
jgi:hypothetical protein